MQTIRWKKNTVLLLWEMLLSAALLVTSIALLMSYNVGVFLAWQLIAVVYIVSAICSPRTGLWPGQRLLGALVWVPPLLVSVVGIQLAILSLYLEENSQQDLEVAAVAALTSVGVLLSWMLVHISFADIYALVDARQDGRAFDFPGEEDHTNLNYVYLAVTIGASFAVSDVTARTRRARVTIIIHSVISFCYNALVVAVAFQVLQKVV